MTPTRWLTLVLTVSLIGAAGCRARARLSLVDVEGRAIDPFDDPSAKAVVFIFVRADCPISNRYAPEVRRLAEKFASRGVAFYPTYPDPEETPEAIRTHMREYGYPGTAVRDADRRLVRMTEARVTPEAAVFVPNGRMVYRGGIDDGYADFGKPRPAPTIHYLEDALDAALGGRPVVRARTTAIGCSIGDLK